MKQFDKQQAKTTREIGTRVLFSTVVHYDPKTVRKTDYINHVEFHPFFCEASGIKRYDHLWIYLLGMCQLDFQPKWDTFFSNFMEFSCHIIMYSYFLNFSVIPSRLHISIFGQITKLSRDTYFTDSPSNSYDFKTDSGCRCIFRSHSNI